MPRPAATRGECEFASEKDSGVLRLLLKVKPGLGEGYDWVGAAGAAPAGRFRSTPRAGGDEADITESRQGAGCVPTGGRDRVPDGVKGTQMFLVRTTCSPPRRGRDFGS